MVKENVGSIKRFGARYGRTVKHRLSKVEKPMRTFQECPYCHAMKVKRLSIGIWECRKCSSKFTGRAYTTSEKPMQLETTEGFTVIKKQVSSHDKV